MLDKTALIRTVLFTIPLAFVHTAAQAQCGNGFFDPEELCVAAAVNVFATPDPIRTVLAVDVDADSFSDIVAITGNRILVRLGTGTGLGPWRWWQYPGVDFRDVAAGDFDADGDLDVAIADRANDRLLVRWNLGGTMYSAPLIVPVGDAPVRVLSARMNGDARDDLAVLNLGSQTVTILLAAGGGFAAASYGVGNTPDIALGDCNGDTQPDLIYVRGQGTSTELFARPNSWGFLGGPLISILPLFDPVYGFLGPLSIASGDLNGDGFDDASVSATWSRLAPATSDGDCTFTAQPYGITWAWTYRQRMLDFDQNGSLDVAVPHGIAAEYSVAWGDNAGSFNLYAVEHLGPVDAPIQDLAFGDFNGDGVRDVLVAAAGGVLLQRGTP